MAADLQDPDQLAQLIVQQYLKDNGFQKGTRLPKGRTSEVSAPSQNCVLRGRAPHERARTFDARALHVPTEVANP